MSGHHHYRVNTTGDRRRDGRDGRANNRLVCSPYYPPHDEQAAWIKGRCIDNAVGLDSRQHQEATVQADHWLNLERSRETVLTYIIDVCQNILKFILV